MTLLNMRGIVKITKTMKTKEVVINKCFGGFGLSHKAVMLYTKLKGIKLYPEVNEISKKVYKSEATLDNPDIAVDYYDGEGESFFGNDIPRDDLILIEVIKKLGKKANDRFSDLKIVKIPTDIEWEINEYDGAESIEEKHKSWS